MSCHRNVKARQNRVEFADMASIAAIAQFLDRHIDVECQKTGLDQEAVIPSIARRFKASAGTLVNILRCKNGKRRVKSVCFSLGSSIVKAALDDIEKRRELFESEVAKQRKELEADHARLMDMAVNANPTALARAEEGLRITREALAEMRAAR